MLLTFEKIREIQLNERSGELQKLPDGFFDDVAEYLRMKADTEEGKTAQRIIINLFERRLKKIANLASIYYPTSKSPDNMSEDEQKIYSEFIASLKRCDSDFKKRLYSVKTMEKKMIETPAVYASPDENQDIADEPGVNEAIQAAELENNLVVADKVKVKFTMDTPELMTPDMETRSFKEGQRAEIPKTFADFLEKKGFCSIERA